MELPILIQKIILAFQTSEFLQISAKAGVIIMTGLIAAHFVSRIIGLVIKKFNWAEKIRKHGIKNPDTFFENASTYIILAIAFIIALNRLGILTTIVSIASLITVSIIVILLVLNFKDMISNFFAGAVLHGMHRNIKPGAKIRAGDLHGEVKKFGLLTTEICTKKKECIIIPNAHLLKCRVEVLRE
ncbi:MAG: mechanosensitive ion channel domain-containing protein [archaeon]